MSTEQQREWPASVLAHTRRMELDCNPLRAKLYDKKRRSLVTIHTANAGAGEGIEHSDEWGRVMAFLLALIRLGITPAQTMTALHVLVPIPDQAAGGGPTPPPTIPGVLWIREPIVTAHAAAPNARTRWDGGQ